MIADPDTPVHEPVPVDSAAAPAHDPAGAAVRVEQLVKRFGDVTAIDQVTLDFARGEFVTLVGPSGCGKTTLLRMIAGLETPTAGRIEILENAVYDRSDTIDVGPHARPISMLFQSYALWPHLTAFGNVEFPLKRRGTSTTSRPSRGERRDLVNEALRVVECESFADRYPSELSGGQQQRIALARAIVGHPHVVLLDEPLSNLDARLRARLRFDLSEIQRTLGFTAIYVTHDRSEALSMSDTVVVMRRGRIEQVGSPEEVYRFPASPYVAQFIGDGNVVVGVTTAVGEESMSVSSPLGEVTCTTPDPDAAPGDEVVLAVPADAVNLEPVTVDGSDAATVVGVAYCGWYTEVLLRLSSGEEATIRCQSGGTLDLGQRVRLQVTESPSGATVIVESDTGTGRR